MSFSAQGPAAFDESLKFSSLRFFPFSPSFERHSAVVLMDQNAQGERLSYPQFRHFILCTVTPFILSNPSIHFLSLLEPIPAGYTLVKKPVYLSLGQHSDTIQSCQLTLCTCLWTMGGSRSTRENQFTVNSQSKSNTGSSCWEATVLDTASLCRPHSTKLVIKTKGKMDGLCLSCKVYINIRALPPRNVIDFLTKTEY